MARCDKPRQLMLFTDSTTSLGGCARSHRDAREFVYLAGRFMGGVAQLSNAGHLLALAESVALRDENARLQAQIMRLEKAATAPRSPRPSLLATAPDPARAGAASSHRASGSGAAGAPVADILDVYRHFVDALDVLAEKWGESVQVSAAPNESEKWEIRQALKSHDVEELRERITQATGPWLKAAAIADQAGEALPWIDLEEWLG